MAFVEIYYSARCFLYIGVYMGSTASWGMVGIVGGCMHDYMVSSDGKVYNSTNMQMSQM